MIINGIEILALTLIVLIFSIAIDLIFGELPNKIHPVVFIGKIIDFFSKYLINTKNRWTGVVLTTIVLIITIFVFSIILILASFNLYIFVIVAAIILSSTFSIKMLLSSAIQIKKDLEKGIDVARKSVSYLVSRNTAKLSEDLIISATIETLSENITDSAISPIFYYILTVILMIAILAITNFTTIFNINEIFNQSTLIVVILAILVAIFYRIINTLDAMVGYENEKLINIGYFPAKLDDVLNYIPARFTGLVIVIASKFYEKDEMNWKNSYNIMKRDARNPPSPNSGFTMAAVAGALNIPLIKKDKYKIGINDNNNILVKECIEKAAKLSKLGIFLAILFLILIFFIFSFIIFFI